MGSPNLNPAPLTIEQLFCLALRQHQTGGLATAEQLYRQILAKEPNHLHALHYLGVIAYQRKNYDLAVDLISRAIVLRPNYAEAYCNLGNVLKDKGQFDQAIAAYRQTIVFNPSIAEAYSNLGNVLRINGQLDEAIAACRRAIELMPDFAGALSNLGNALKDKGELDEAIDAYRRAIVLQPSDAVIYNNLGSALKDKGRLDEAIASYRRAIVVQPNYASAHNDLGSALKDQGQLDEAIAAYRQAIALKPDYADAHYNLANAFNAAGKLDAAIAALREAIRLKEDSPDWRFLLAALTGDNSASRAPTHYVQVLFDDYAACFDQHLLGKLNYHVPELLLHAVLAVAPGRQFDIFDLGCGTGLCGAQFRPHARHLVGVDLSSMMLKKAAERKTYDQLVTADALAALQERPDGCDLILAGDVFIYMGDLSAIFPAAARALRPRGLFAFSIERYAGPGFVLHSKCRFAHSLSYVRQLAQRHDLAELHAQEIVVRKEGNAEVPGWIVVLGKKEVRLKANLE